MEFATCLYEQQMKIANDITYNTWKKTLVDMMISWFPFNFMMLKILTNISKKTISWISIRKKIFQNFPNVLAKKEKHNYGV